MRQIIFVCGSSSVALADRVRVLRTDYLAGNVELLVPEEGGIEDEEWLMKHAKEAAIIAFFHVPSDLPEAEEIEDCRDGHGNGGRKCQVGETPVVSIDRLRRLPTNAQIVWAVLSSAHRTPVPAELREFASYDLSDPADKEAFLCRLTHDPVHSRQTLRTDVRNDLCLLIIGGVATALNQVEAVREHLRRLFPEIVVTFVHWVMLCLVAFAFAWGVWGLLRLAWRSLRVTLPTFRRVAPASSRRRTFLSGGGFIVLLVIAIVSVNSYTRLPSIDELDFRERERMARKLERAFASEGGIRAHTQEKAIQVWTTAQGLNGLLSCQPGTLWSTNTPKDVRRAFDFIDRTQINPVQWKSDGRKQSAAALAGDVTNLPTYDLARLPDQFPTLTMALNVTRKEIGAPDWKVLLVAPKFKDFFDSVTPQPPMEGWGYFEQMDWGVTEVAAWVALSYLQSLRKVDPPIWRSDDEREGVKRRIRWIIGMLQKRQMSGGGFSPIIEISESDYARTYPTVMAVWAMDEALASPAEVLSDYEVDSIRQAMGRGLTWLSQTALVSKPVGQGQDAGRLTGWKVDPSNPRDEVLDGLTVHILWVSSRAAAATKVEESTEKRFDQIKKVVIEQAEGWMSRSMANNPRMHDSDGYLYPTARMMERSTFLWYPWTVALLREMSVDPRLENSPLQKRAKHLHRRLLGRAAEFGEFAAGTGNEYNYVAAEGLIGLSWPQRGGAHAER